ADAAAHDKRMPPGFRLASLDQILLAVNIEAIPPAARDFRDHIQAFAVLYGYPFCLTYIDRGVSEMDGGDVSHPYILGGTDANKIPAVLLIRKVFFFLNSDLRRHLLVKLGIAAQILDPYLANSSATVKSQ